MPEMPEVETITRKLREKVPGQRIELVKVENEKVIAYPDVKRFIELLTGKMIFEVNRRGKFIILGLSGELNLVAHMRMTGRIYAVTKETPMEKHTHLIVELSNGLELRFVDPRRFGRFWLASESEVEELTGLGNLGVEPLSGELTAEYLKSKLGKRRKAIKTLLLDQDVVTGIGNIYADESLHKARIFPGKKASEMTDEEFERLAQAIPETLALNLENCLAQADDQLLSLLDYRTSSTIVTYQHQNTPCPDCGADLEKIKINGRGTCYCPKCQPKDS